MTNLITNMWPATFYISRRFSQTIRGVSIPK